MSIIPFVLAALQAPQADAVAAAPADQLTALLASADEIDAVTASARGVAFTIENGDQAFRVEASTHDARITSVEIIDLGPAHAKAHPFSWLADELQESPAGIVTLRVDAAGHVTLATDEGTQYQLAASKSPNAAVSARWAAAWDHDG